MCLFVPSLTIAILALVNTLGISTGVTTAALGNSWLQIGLLALPVYLVVNIIMSMIVKGEPGATNRFIESQVLFFSFDNLLLFIYISTPMEDILSLVKSEGYTLSPYPDFLGIFQDRGF